MANKHRGVYVIDGKLKIDFVLNGKRHREWYSNKVHDTAKLDAEKYRKKVIESIRIGNFNFADWFPNSKHAAKKQVPTLTQATEEWLGRQIVKYNTLRSYRIGMNFWNKTLGDAKLPEINFAMIQKLITDALNQGSHTPHTLNNYMVPLRGLFADAKKLKLVESDPMVEIDQLAYQQEEPKPIKNSDDIEAIIAELYQMHPQVGNYYGFAFFSGLRVSELIELKWSDIDLNKKPRPVMVITRAKTNGKVGPTKGKRLRRLPLNVRALEYLKDQMKYTLLKNGHVFENPNINQPWHSDKFQRDLWWNVALKNLGIERHRAYATRHSFASHLIARGVQTHTVSKQLGHSTVRTTERFYAGDIPEQEDRQGDLIDEALNKQIAEKKKDASNS